MSAHTQTRAATGRLDYGSSLPSRSIFLLPDGTSGTSRPGQAGRATGRGVRDSHDSARSSVELYSESRTIALHGAGDTGAAGSGVGTAGVEEMSVDDPRVHEPFARLRKAVADYVGEEADAAVSSLVSGDAAGTGAGSGARGSRGVGGGRGGWVDPDELADDPGDGDGGGGKRAADDPPATDTAAADVLADSPLPEPSSHAATRPTGGLGGTFNDTLASVDFTSRLQREEAELAEFEALERQLAQPGDDAVDPRASHDSFAAQSERSSFGDTQAWGTMNWKAGTDASGGHGGSEGGRGGGEARGGGDEQAGGRRPITAHAATDRTRVPAYLSQSAGHARGNHSTRPSTGHAATGRASTGRDDAGSGGRRAAGNASGGGGDAAVDADGAPVSSLVERMFHSQRGRRGGGGTAHGSGSRPPTSAHSRRPVSGSSRRGAGANGGGGGVGGGGASAVDGRSAELDAEVAARVAELEKEVAQYKAERRKLSRERTAFIRDMERQKQEWEAEKQRQLADIEEQRHEMEVKMKKERRVMQRQAKAAAVAAANNRKERAEVDALKAKIAKMKVDEGGRAAKHKSNVERLQQRVKSLSQRNKELVEEVEFLEAQRLEQWGAQEASDGDNNARDRGTSGPAGGPPQRRSRADRGGRGGPGRAPAHATWNGRARPRGSSRDSSGSGRGSSVDRRRGSGGAGGATGRRRSLSSDRSAHDDVGGVTSDDEALGHGGVSRHGGPGPYARPPTAPGRGGRDHAHTHGIDAFGVVRSAPPAGGNRGGPGPSHGRSRSPSPAASSRTASDADEDRYHRDHRAGANGGGGDGGYDPSRYGSGLDDADDMAGGNDVDPEDLTRHTTQPGVYGDRASGGGGGGGGSDAVGGGGQWAPTGLRSRGVDAEVAYVSAPSVQAPAASMARAAASGAPATPAKAPAAASVLSSPLAGVTRVPGAGKTVVSQRQFGEGKTETVYADGTRVFTYRNNTTRELSPEGHIIVRFHNGDIRKTHTSTGVEVYYFAEAKTTHTSFPDGSQLYEFPNGQVERHFPDASKEIKYPDGTVKEVLPSGEMRSVFPDGTRLTELPDGRKIIYGADGKVQSEVVASPAVT